MTKVALVTGASSGIGYAVCEELAHGDYKIYACARSVEKITTLADKYPNVIPLELDITSIESILYAKKKFQEENEELDILFNVAGISCAAPAIEVDEETYRRAFEVNFFGAVNMTREFSKLVIEAKGVLAFTTSTGVLLPFPFSSINNASKAALSAYVSTLAIEVKPFGVRVIDFVTGGVKTDMINKAVEDSQSHVKADSLYTIDGKSVVVECMKKLDNSSFPTAQEYAKKAVHDIEHPWSSANYLIDGNYFQKYRGYMSRVSKFSNFYFHRSLVEGMMIGGFNLKKDFDQLSREHRQ